MDAKVSKHPSLTPIIRNDFREFNIGLNPSSDSLMYYQGDSNTDLSLTGVQSLYSLGNQIVVEADNGHNLHKTLVVDRDEGLVYFGILDKAGPKYKGLEVIRQPNPERRLFQIKGYINGEEVIAVPNIFRNVVTPKFLESAALDSLVLGPYSNMRVTVTPERIEELLVVTKSQKNPGVKITYKYPNNLISKFRRHQAIEWQGVESIRTGKDSIIVNGKSRRMFFVFGSENFDYVRSEPTSEDGSQDILIVDLPTQTAAHKTAPESEEIQFSKVIFKGNDSQALHYTGEIGSVPHRIAVQNAGEVSIRWDSNKFLADFEEEMQTKMDQLLSEAGFTYPERTIPEQSSKTKKKKVICA